MWILFQKIEAEVSKTPSQVTYAKLLTLEGSVAGGTLLTEYHDIQNSQSLRPALYLLMAEPTDLLASALSVDFLRPLT